MAVNQSCSGAGATGSVLTMVTMFPADRHIRVLEPRWQDRSLRSLGSVVSRNNLQDLQLSICQSAAEQLPWQ
jgi:hypothetical protein